MGIVWELTGVVVVSGPRVINQGRTGRMNERRVRKEGKKKRREEG